MNHLILREGQITILVEASTDSTVIFYTLDKNKKNQKQEQNFPEQSSYISYKGRMNSR